MVERMVGVGGGVEVCAESFGDAGDPAVLLVMGLGASMLWWEDGFCRQLAAGGRFVVRYDHRDTGRSAGWEPGRPGYTGADLAGDAVGVLDGYGIGAAHLVGVSAGGALAQRVALGSPERVRSLVLVSTTSAVPGGPELPPPAEEFLRFAGTARQPDWTRKDEVVDYLVAYSRVLAGTRRPFDEPAARALIRADVERARDIAAARNHDILPEGEPPPAPLSAISAPTLVVHGTADPLFPFPHGEFLAEAIPGAGLLPLEGAGHGIVRADWPALVRAILAHTAA